MINTIKRILEKWRKHEESREIIYAHQGENGFEIKYSGDYRYTKQAIYKNGKRITPWFDEVYSEGLVSGQSEFFRVAKGLGFAVFRYKNGEVKQISNWMVEIRLAGLIKGESKFSIGRNFGERGVFLFEWDGEKIRKISSGFNDIWEYGLVKGQSEFFVAKRDEKEAIFKYEDNKITQVSPWFDGIWLGGLIDKRSKFFVVRELGKYAVFRYWDDKAEQITDWFGSIGDYGLISGETNYFFVEKENTRSIYHKALNEPVVILKSEIGWPEKTVKSMPKFKVNGNC